MDVIIKKHGRWGGHGSYGPPWLRHCSVKYCVGDPAGDDGQDCYRTRMLSLKDNTTRRRRVIYRVALNTMLLS